MTYTAMRPWKYGGPPVTKESKEMKEPTKKLKKQPKETQAQMNSYPNDAEESLREQICSQIKSLQKNQT